MKTKCIYCKKSLWGIPINHTICVRNETELNEYRIEQLYYRISLLEKKRDTLLNDEWEMYLHLHRDK